MLTKSVPRDLALSADIYSRAVEDSAGCWVWQGWKDNGYGRIRSKGQVYKVHRVSYEYLVHEIPDGLVIDHLCSNRSCINPYHMEPVTQAINAARVDQTPKMNGTHCGNQHPLDIDNVYMYQGLRKCKTCRRDTQRRFRENK